MGIRRDTLPSLSIALITIVFLGLVPAAAPSTNSQGFATDLEGKPFDPFHAAPGKVVVLIFVRTDCPVSNRYAPTIQRLAAERTGQAAFFLVYPSRKETADVIRRHEKDFGYTFPGIRDPQHALVKQSAAQITPEAAVFNAAGRLVYHGRIDNLYEDFGHARRIATTHELADAIEAAIAGKTLSGNATPAVGCYISDLE
jgi:thiol-disulfide isomerase/thioredoxin